MKRAIRANLLVSLLLSFGLAACGVFKPSPTPTLTPTPTTIPTSTSTATLIPSPTITVTPLPTATQVPTATATPTPLFLVQSGTPLPLPLSPILLSDADQVSGLAAWQEKTVTDLAWTPDGKYLGVAVFDGIAIYDAQTRTRQQFLPAKAEEGLVSIAFSPKGNFLASGNQFGSEQEGYSGNVDFWRATNWEPMGILFGVSNAITKVAFSPDGSTFATVVTSQISTDNFVDFWDTTTWEITRTLKTGAVLNIAFSPDGKLLATTPDRYAIKIWDVKTGKLLNTLYTSFTGAVNSLAFAPGSSLLASGHYDGTIRIWDALTGELKQTLNSEGVVECLAFSPDGRILASGDSYKDNAIRLWDIELGQLVRLLEGHTHGVEHLAFSPDGQLLVSASYDGSLRLWGVRP